MQRNREYYAANDFTGNERSAAFQRRNKDVKAAHDAVYRALKSGKLTRGPCEQCGDPDTQAHHDDYSMPLSVRWLCLTHHYHHHVQEREHARTHQAAE
jgi:hypothetical protein